MEALKLDGGRKFLMGALHCLHSRFTPVLLSAGMAWSCWLDLRSILLAEKMKVKSLSHVRLFATPWTVAYQAFPAMGFSFQARIPEWVAISFSRRSSRPRDWTWVSHIVGGRFIVWAAREVLSCHQWFWCRAGWDPRALGWHHIQLSPPSCKSSSLLDSLDSSCQGQGQLFTFQLV